MDLNKLKNRLNVKFEPIQAQRQSLKKLVQVEQNQTQKPKAQQKKQSNQRIKFRSNSQIKLPSISNRSKQRYETIEDSRSIVDSTQIKQRVKSFKQIPKVKIESKEDINKTISFLMKNEILNVPRIVALLQKSHSDQFIYLKAKGVYQFEACDERQKGSNYVTLSRNGMVQNGELIPLQVLTREFQICKKLNKIQFFKNFHIFKYLHKWKDVSLKVLLQKTRDKINKNLHLKDRNFQQWKIQLFWLFEIHSEGGWIQQNWIYKLSDNLKMIKESCKNRLLTICYKMLEPFDLPISESPDLLNRVLANLTALNTSFEKKIRIQKELQKFYLLGRQIQLNAMQKTASFILVHLRTLIKKVANAKHSYQQIILQKLEQLKLDEDQYNQKRLKILSDSLISFDVDYSLYYNGQDKILDIRPSPTDIYGECEAQIRLFLKQCDRMGFKIIRTDDFNFVIKNVFKSGLDTGEKQEEEGEIFKNFVFSMNSFDRLSTEYEKLLISCQPLFKRRIQLFQPFLDLYHQYLNQQTLKNQFNYHEVVSKHEKIEQDRKFCQKLDEGEYFIIGFLKTSQFKRDLLNEIKRVEDMLFKSIPINLMLKKQKLNNSLNDHLTILNNQQSTAYNFIKTSQQVEKIEDSIHEYTITIDEIQKCQQFYEKQIKVKLHLLKDEKKMLNEIRVKMKNFVQSREHNFIKYRKSLEHEKELITKKINLYSNKNDQFYSPKSSPHQTYNQINTIVQSLKSIQKELIQLNRLQLFYNLKPTTFSSLQMLIKEYQNLQDIWRFTLSVIQDETYLERRLVRDIPQQKYLKTYEPFKKRTEKFLKDTDLYAITQHSLIGVQRIISNMQTIQLINSSHLRTSDLQEINYHIERKMSSQNFGSLKIRLIHYDTFNQMKVAQSRNFIAECVFKAKKEIQIAQNLVQFRDWWKSIKLEHEFMEQYPLIAIFGENSKIRDQIDEYMTMLINILNNKYGSFVRSDCNQLLSKMNNLIQMLQLAQMHQQKFLNLFPILTSKYAQSQLSGECKKFQTILTKTMKNTRLLIKPTENLNQSTKGILKNHIKHFDAISIVISKFLQSKRLKFQRFYFLQDYELLEVLVGIADEKNVFRMFQGIKGWLVSPEGIKIGVIGIGDEKLVLKGWSYKSTEPQNMFKSLEQSIKSNLNSIVRNIIYQYQIQLKELRNLYEQIPWMCLYAVEMILFTKQVQLNCFHQKFKLDAQQSLLREAINYATVKPTQYSNYITMLLHLLHYTQQMRKENVSSIFDFQWHSFLRFYYQKDSVMMRSLSNQIKWGGQYQGMWNLMVYTSDIQRAHVCVLNNIQYANGVLLQGPSGTGKTESLKQLARCTAKYCVIFNCSQSVNLRTVSKLLSGLCYTSSWLCLDEINRLTVEAMSSIAKQIQTIRNAILAKKDVFNFMGKDIHLKKGVAIFSTMNPIYLKRAKLTENIKSCFRTVTVTMPEQQTIIQIMLYGLKFGKPRQLSHSIASTFSNLSIQLSKGSQYDFGLRAVKFLMSSISKRRQNFQNQEQLVARAFYDVFYFRLNSHDKPIFEKVIKDIFRCQNHSFLSSQFNRIQVMRETPQTGIIIMGPVSIKSTLIRQFCSSYHQPEISLYNHNSIDMRYFLGETIHGKWEEGIVQKFARLSISNGQKMHILVLDSVLKSEIIQNFNTLLDESKLLTLSNGSRIKVQNNFKLIMQSPHLNLISPSTVTRCNIIYVSDKDVDTKQLILAQLPQGLKGNSANARITKIFSKLSNNEIREVGKISKIIISEKYSTQKDDWKQNQILGLQKAVIFSAKLLGIDNKIQQFITKENSFNSKKSPFHHILAFERFSQGEFLQISRNYEPIIEYNNFTLKTSQQIFMKWLTKKATARHMQPILWKGSPFTGKSKGLSFSLKSEKYIKIPLNNSMYSSALTGLLLPQILDKKIDDIKEKPELIIYIQNLHMSNQQMSEQIRFMMEHNKMFSVQVRQAVSIQILAFVAQSRHVNTKQFDRVRRHFTQLQTPSVDHIEVKNIYSQILIQNLKQTNIDDSIKSSINIEADRFCTFLANIYQKKYSSNTQRNKKLGPYVFTRILQRVKHLNLSNCRQVSDFIAFMFQATKLQDLLGADPSILQQIHLCYHELYKGKFVKEFEMYLKNQNVILETISSADDSPRKQRKVNLIPDLDSLKGIHLSHFIRKQIQFTFRILENIQSHYCLVGPDGSGRKTILTSACKLKKNISYFELPQQTNQKQIRKIYFQRIKSAFQSKKKEIVILDVKYKGHIKFLQLAQSIAIGQSIVKLYDSEQTDYMFATISDHADNYSKSSKSYEEICQDYVRLAHQHIKFLIVSTEGVKMFLNMPTLIKKMYWRNLPNFPIESLVETVQNILKQRIYSSEVLKERLMVGTLPKVFMKIYKILNGLSAKNKQLNINHFNFNQFHLFKLAEQFCKNYQRHYLSIKQKQDILNRSISKIMEVKKTLAKLREDIIVMEPAVQAKKQKIIQVFPILEQKKKRSEAVKMVVEQQRLQIQQKAEELSTIMKQVKDQIEQCTPLLAEAIDSVQTIKRSELSQLKNNTNPHPLIKFTLQNMVILFGQSQNWDNVRKNLSDANLQSRIKSCQPPTESYLRVKKRIQQNPEWSFETVSKVSIGARYLVKWINSIIRYKDIESQIKKKREYIEKLKLNLKQSEQKAGQKMVQLQNKEKDCANVEKQYSIIKKELNDLEILMEINKNKLVNAENINNNLQENFIKWEQQLRVFREVKTFLTGFVLLLNFQFSISPILTTQQITFIKKQITKVFAEESINLPTNQPNLTDFIEGTLLGSSMSHEDMLDKKKVNLAFYFDKVPLLIDPDNQISSWLSRLNIGQKIVYTNKSYRDSGKTVQEAMRFGFILGIVIQNQFDNFVKQILKSMENCQRGNRNMIQYNKNIFSLSKDFKLFFVCRTKNCQINPEIYLSHQIINFEITKLSLQHNLFEIALKSEKPGLYAAKQQADISLIKLLKKIKEAEEKIMDALINKKNLIQDKNFIQLLVSNKQNRQALVIIKREQQKQMEEMDIFHKQFTDVCSSAAEIFVSLKEMTKININLTWDVQIIKRYFSEALLDSISHILEQQQQFYENFDIEGIGAYQFQQFQPALSRPTSALSSMSVSVSRVASQQSKQQFEQHIPNANEEINFKLTANSNETPKPIFHVNERIIDEDQRGTVKMERGKKIYNYLIQILKKAFTQQERYLWALILCLKQQKKEEVKSLLTLIAGANKKRNLKQLIDQNTMTQNIKSYFSQFQANNIDSQALKIISKFQRGEPDVNKLFSEPQLLMLGYTLKPESMLSFVTQVIKYNNFQKIIEYDELKVSDWLHFSDSIHPILLMMGEDPLPMISQYLQRKKYKHATLVAIGQYQGRDLDVHIEKQSRKEGIFIIQNFHLASSFFPSLVRLIQQFSIRPPHKNFRLILISALETTLPEQAASLCHKYIVEQPSGLKNQMKDLYKKSEVYIDHSIETQHKLCYSLCLMHSLINQMKKYGSICWNFFPGYSTSDFIGSILSIKSISQKKDKIADFQCNLDPQQIQKQMMENKIDFNGLKYLIGQLCYVGKMSDNFDRRKMRIIIDKHFNEDIFSKGYIFWQGSRLSDQPSDVSACISSIHENSPKVCGLYDNALQAKQFYENVFNKLSSLNEIDPKMNLGNTQKFSEIKAVYHKIPFVNEEIQNYNQTAASDTRSILLRQITENTKIFNLKAFQYPKQLFVSVILQAAIKNSVPYDNIALIWSVASKEGSYGISNLTLQGANIKNGALIPGYQQNEITLYFSPLLKKKDKDPNKGKTGIPLYLSEQRGQSLDNYGQNTNMLTLVYLDSKQQPQSWILKGTAFVVA